jgi:hypothetical protein
VLLAGSQLTHPLIHAAAFSKQHWCPSKRCSLRTSTTGINNRT